VFLQFSFLPPNGLSSIEKAFFGRPVSAALFVSKELLLQWLASLPNEL
jgi:hypothetical protein